MQRRLTAIMKNIGSPVKRFISSKRNGVDVSLKDFMPITEFNRGDVFLVGYPKSGNTWFQHLVATAIYGITPRYAPDTLIQEIIPDIHAKRYYKRYATPMFFVTHDLPKPEYRRVVYLLRDGRDVMVSYFHHLSAVSGKEVDFLKMTQNAEGLWPCRWHEHVNLWLSNPYNAQMLVIKYEDLKENAVSELHRFCTFIGLEREAEFLRFVVESCSFQIMRKKEIRCGWDNENWPKDKFFVRRGQVGSYKDEMPPSILEAFLNDAEATLCRCGYFESR